MYQIGSITASPIFIEWHSGKQVQIFLGQRHLTPNQTNLHETLHHAGTPFTFGLRKSVHRKAFRQRDIANKKMNIAQ